MFVLSLLSLAVLLAVPIASAQTNYYPYAEAAFTGLQSFYNTTSGLWDTCGWWNGANCLTTIADLALVDGNIAATATSVFAHAYTAAPPANPRNQVMKLLGPHGPETLYGTPPRPPTRRDYPSVDVDGFLDGCYDDNAWWALAWIAAYDLTKIQNYLDLAEGIYVQNITGGGPTKCGNGGILWCADNTYVNAIANELYLSVAAHLANRIPDKASDYVAQAQKQWSWFQASGLINSDHLINDGLEDDCTNNGSRKVWSYNQGVILGALVELNQAAPDSSLIDTANAIAAAAIANLTDANHVLHDPCEPDCAPDATQFKGIFIRNLLKLHQTSPNDAYKQVILASADSIWANDRDTNSNTFSVDWAGPIVQPINASTSSSAMDALVAAISV